MHGHCSAHSLEFLQSRMLSACEEKHPRMSQWTSSHPCLCSRHIRAQCLSLLFMIELLMCSNSGSRVCASFPLPAPSACPSLPPLSHIVPGYSWLPLEKTGKYRPPGMADPESVFSFPKDLGFLCIYFRSCFCGMQIFNSGSLKQFSPPLWASAVPQVNEFSIPGEFGTFYLETLSVCKYCSALWELQIFPISEVMS